jgi:DNA-binding response OmpR family regulator
VAVVEGDREAAEMLHMFFRLMELECSLVPADSRVLPTLRRLSPDILILDLDLPDLRAMDIARAIRLNDPAFPLIFVSDDTTSVAPIEAPLMRKPRDRFEELLKLFELVLEVWR